ncbi:hypothetical protein PHMEG_000162 [Phytophthora megakarya]|uniref:Chromo domain-containing protein n=1 Tax=Phytophthora megakarya TaxID=4795 RepID=A0A225X626_9STRA|nr:hypothetical protein PHMEG_000162 [Phytophthora megakarya]
MTRAVPFAMPPPSAVGGVAYTGADDGSMAMASPGREDDLDERMPVRVTSAPTLPPSPRYSGSTIKARRDFMRAYQTYVHALSAFDTPFGKLFFMPVNPNLVTEEEWVQYFLQALEPELEDYSVLRANMHKILDVHIVEGVRIAHEQKKLVKYLVAALEPVDFRETIRKHLEYAQHKPLKSDIVKCYMWLLEELKAYLVWQPRVVDAILRNLDCFVHEEDETIALTISRLVMQQLGYSTDGLLAAARKRQEEYCLTDDSLPHDESTPLVRMQAVRVRVLQNDVDDSDDVDELVTTPTLAATTTTAVQEALALKLQEARVNGLPDPEGDELRDLLLRYVDVFCLSFGNDSPVRVPPLQVRLKEGVRPVKAKARRLPPAHKRYLEEHIRELEEHGLLVKNYRGRWASAPRIVTKRPPDDYRMTVDTRAVNALTDPMPWPMPDIEGDLAQVEESNSYFIIDCEQRLHMSEWPNVLPMVQTALNQMPADRLGGMAPVTAFAALPASSPILTILHPRSAEVMDVTRVYEQQKQHVVAVQGALEWMYRELSESAKKRQEQARARRTKKHGVEISKFSIGDFGLVAQVTTHSNKLAVHWRGPHRIINTLNDYIFEVQNISPSFEESTHHASRLRFYAESGRDVTEDLIEQAMHGDGGHIVSKLLRCRIGADSHVWEIEVEWVGLNPLEASWEPAAIMYEDVPGLIKKFVRQQSADSEAHAMLAALIGEREPQRGGKGKARRG